MAETGGMARVARAVLDWLWQVAGVGWLGQGGMTSLTKARGMLTRALGRARSLDQGERSGPIPIYFIYLF